jgi:hypothetical protein
MIMLCFGLFLGMALLLSGLTYATWAAKKDTKDADITRAVETELIHDPRVFSFSPDVDVYDGTVTLTSTADILKPSVPLRRMP